MYALQCPQDAHFGSLLYFQLHKFLFDISHEQPLFLFFKNDNQLFSKIGMDGGIHNAQNGLFPIINFSPVSDSKQNYFQHFNKDFTFDQLKTFIEHYFSYIKTLEPIPEDTLVLHLRSNRSLHKPTHHFDIPSYLDQIPFKNYKNVIVISKDEYMVRNWLHGRDIPNLQYQHSESPLEDFNFMARAKSLAITTSSMGYWAAYISHIFFNSKVYCPLVSPPLSTNVPLIENARALHTFTKIQTYPYFYLNPKTNRKNTTINGCIVMLVTKPYFRYLFRGFYESINQCMEPNVDVLVYTDDASDPVFDIVKDPSLPFHNRVHIQQKDLPSDYQQLLWDKWTIFNNFFIENPQYNHIYHFNVNVRFTAPIDLPSLTDSSRKEGFLTLHMTEHIYDYNHYKFFKDDMDACCYIEPKDIHYYYFGGYVSMSKYQYDRFYPIVKEWMDTDVKNNKFHSALYRDETYYNKFFNLSSDQANMDVFPHWYLKTNLINKIDEFKKYFKTPYNPHDILIIDKPRNWGFYGLKDGDDTYAFIEYNKRIKKVHLYDDIYRLDFLNDDEKPLVVKQDPNNPLLFSNEEVLNLQAEIQSKY